MGKTFLCIKDEEGVLRPMAGIWEDSEYGRMKSNFFLTTKKKYKNCKIVKVAINQHKLNK